MFNNVIALGKSIGSAKEAFDWANRFANAGDDGMHIDLATGALGDVAKFAGALHRLAGDLGYASQAGVADAAEQMVGDHLRVERL